MTYFHWDEVKISRFTTLAWKQMWVKFSSPPFFDFFILFYYFKKLLIQIPTPSPREWNFQVTLKWQTISNTKGIFAIKSPCQPPSHKSLHYKTWIHHCVQNQGILSHKFCPTTFCDAFTQTCLFLYITQKIILILDLF